MIVTAKTPHFRLFYSLHFFTTDDCTKTIRFLKAINGGKKKGGLFCQLGDQDLNRYIMRVAGEFQMNNPDAFQSPKIVPSWHGKQEDNIWVLNEQCQIDQHGNQINVDDSHYRWLVNYIAIGDKRLRKLESTVKLPLRKKSLANALKILKKTIPGQLYECMFNNYLFLKV